MSFVGASDVVDFRFVAGVELSVFLALVRTVVFFFLSTVLSSRTVALALENYDAT